MQKYTLLYSTCDAYDDLWKNFFILLKKYWPSFNGRIIFNSEKKFYQNEAYNIVNVEHPTDNLSWSDRLYDALKLVETEYVLFVLDDFYLRDYVNTTAFNACIDFMDANPDVMSIAFSKEPGIKKTVREIDGFSFRKHFSLYKTTAHLSLYRTSFLKKILRTKESAWDFEVNSTFRSYFKKGRFICATTNSSPVFPYDYGALVIGGKFIKNIKERFEKAESIIFSDKRECATARPTPSKKGLFRKIRKLKYPIKGLLSFLKARPK